MPVWFGCVTADWTGICILGGGGAAQEGGQRMPKKEGYLGPIRSSGTSDQGASNNQGKVSEPPKKEIPDPLGLKSGK